MTSDHQHKWEKNYYCYECDINGIDDPYHDQCVICGEIA